MLRDREARAATYLASCGVMISWPGEGIEDSGLKWHWGVHVGSHGGYGKTLRGAMGACLRCCGLGRWWHVQDGRLLAAVFSSAKERYLRRHLDPHAGRGIPQSGCESPPS